MKCIHSASLCKTPRRKHQSALTSTGMWGSAGSFPTWNCSSFRAALGPGPIQDRKHQLRAEPQDPPVYSFWG